MRAPSDILADYDLGGRGAKDIDMRELLWEVLDDVCDSFRLAMHNAGVPAAKATEVTTTVNDYLASNYGDDQ